MGREAAEAERSGVRSEGKKVGSESTRNLEVGPYSARPRAIMEFCLLLAGRQHRIHSTSRRIRSRFPESHEQRVLNKVPLQVVRNASRPTPSGEG